MAKKNVDGDILWSDRKHWMWFPFSFTTYQLSPNRLYQQTGLLKTHYDETLLYKIIDICLERTLLQKLFGTGTITLTTRSDSQGRIVIKNIKNPMETKKLISRTVEEDREAKKVVGKEFYGTASVHGVDYDDLDDDGDFDDHH